jgi:hypothetical protein
MHVYTTLDTVSDVPYHSIRTVELSGDVAGGEPHLEALEAIRAINRET